jgi:hypothetical protein
MIAEEAKVNIIEGENERDCILERTQVVVLSNCEFFMNRVKDSTAIKLDMYSRTATKAFADRGGTTESSHGARMVCSQSLRLSIERQQQICLT